MVHSFLGHKPGAGRVARAGGVDMRTYRISGTEAIRLAERDQLTLRCYANPLDDGGAIGLGEARQVVKEDPGLIYVEVAFYGYWWDGERFTTEMPGYNIEDYFDYSTGMYLGPDDDGVEPIWADAPVEASHD